MGREELLEPTFGTGHVERQFDGSRTSRKGGLGKGIGVWVGEVGARTFVRRGGALIRMCEGCGVDI